MRYTLWVALGLVLFGMGQAALPAGALAQGAVSDDVVRIAVLTDMSGPYADIGGPGSVEAARMAVADFGGKVLGKSIDVVYADHQNKADVASQIVRSWIDTQGVDMIVDANNSAVALAVDNIVTEKKRIYIAGGVATTRLTNEDCSPYVVQYVFDSYALAHGTAGAIVKNGGKSWFFLTVDYAGGIAQEKDAADAVRAAGGTVVGQVRHPINTSDFSAFMLQAQASKAEVIGLANFGNDTINAIKSANEFGVTKNQTLAGLLIFITDIHSLGIGVTQGMLMTEGWYWDYDADTRALGRRFFEKMKRMPTMTQAGVFSAVLSYLKSVHAAGTDNADAVMAELKKLKINDSFAKNAYIREDGRMMHDMYLMQVKAPSESKYPWDYYNVKAIIPAEQAFQPLALSRCRLVKK
ncbi:MAG: ABC transporter substrate-binding protein [SAR324 cluster bacterium]